MADSQVLFQHCIKYKFTFYGSNMSSVSVNTFHHFIHKCNLNPYFTMQRLKYKPEPPLAPAGIGSGKLTCDFTNLNQQAKEDLFKSQHI